MSNFRKLTAILFALALLPLSLSAQQPTTISGRVTTEAGAPLENASVFIPSLNLGTLTNNEGRYCSPIPRSGPST